MVYLLMKKAHNSDVWDKPVLQVIECKKDMDNLKEIVDLADKKGSSVYLALLTDYRNTGDEVDSYDPETVGEPWRAYASDIKNIASRLQEAAYNIEAEIQNIDWHEVDSLADELDNAADQVMTELEDDTYED